MAYFNHAFSKRFLGTGATRTALSTGAPITALNPASTDGMITTVGTTTATLSTLTPGYFGFFDPKTYECVGTVASVCCPLLLASSALQSNDKIGPFHGGYKETNKSKVINPKYIQAAYRVDDCVPKQAIVSVGNTPQTGSGITALDAGSLVGGTGYTNGQSVVAVSGGTGSGATVTITVALGVVTAVVLKNAGTAYTIGDTLTLVGGNSDATIDVLTVSSAGTLDPNMFQGGTTDATCAFEFLCGETYYLRVDVKGSPALRALNHNAYQTLSAYTGCCVGPVPTAVDSTLVMIEWAKALIINNYLKPFVLPVVFDEAGVAWYAPDTTVDPISGAAILPAQWWTAYVSPGHVAGASAGLRLFGAYVGTVFGDCTFQITDFFEREPVKIYASLVDYNGDPCVFEGLCVYNDCLGLQGMGFGDTVLKDFILSESYLQNFFHSDLRIREITQGYDISTAIPRNALYTRYYILHSVPRFNNPSGTFDNERYMLEVVTGTAGNAALDAFLTTWLGACADCVPFDTHACVACTPVAN